MNLDERIKGLFYSVGLYPDYSKDVVAEQESVKQLIRDVLEYVKPAPLNNKTMRGAAYDAAIEQMKAKQKELGL